jgi:hypothetical protein
VAQLFSLGHIRTMSTFATYLWIAACVLLVVWLGVTCLVGFQMLFSRQSHNAKLEALHRKLGDEWHPISRLHWAWVWFRCIPMLLFFSILAIFWFVVHLPYVIWCFVTGRKQVGGLPEHRDL